MFEGFCIVLGRPELGDTEWAGLATRVARIDEWQRIIDEALPDRPVAEIVEQAAALRVPVSPVHNAKTLPTNEHVVARGMLLRDGDGVLRPRPPYRLDDDPVPAPRRAPQLGEHDGDVEPSVRPRPTDPGADPSVLPLAGVKVLDLTSWWAGTSSTHVLAILGAEVIHVESITHPDGMRLTGAMFGAEQWWEYGHMFAVANTEKLDLTLDATTARGRELLVRLVEWADVFVENFAPRVVENWGLDRDAVLAINPDIVYTRMPGFGLDGPWRERGAFAQTQEQMTGLAWITGYPDDLPLIPRGIADPNAGMHAAFAVLVAMAQRDRTGQGVFVEAPMAEAALNIAAQPVMEYSAYGYLMERMGNRSPRIAPQGLYACRGFEQWLALSVATDEQWRGLKDALGDPKWAQDRALDTLEGRLAHHDELDAELREWAVEQDVDEVVALLASHHVPAAGAYDPRVLSRHPHLVARHFFEEVDHPVLGRHPAPGMPYRFAGVERWLHRATPTLGQDNHDVLSRILGLSDAEIAVLEDDGVIGTRPTGL
jgi:crotonobetainyl-CoA:carnitine CoA-transferase CaiB-like acyl-CoA transferase